MAVGTLDRSFSIFRLLRHVGKREFLREHIRVMKKKVRPKVISEICGVLWSRLYFGFESAGLGIRMSEPRRDRIRHDHAGSLR